MQIRKTYETFLLKLLNRIMNFRSSDIWGSKDVLYREDFCNHFNLVCLSLEIHLKNQFKWQISLL